jgi:hypothetical protein
VSKHCEWTFNLLGEPAMPVWIDTPGTMTVTHPGSIALGSQDFTIEVKDGGTVIDGALVCAMKANEVYETGVTGSNGRVTLRINPLSEGTMYVTVTAMDYLPYEGTCQVIGEPPDVSVTITPDSTVIPRGESLGYTVTVTNNGTSNITLNYWTDIHLWNGGPYPGNPVFGPITGTLGAGQSREGHLSHTVPSNAPLRTYSCYGRIGGYPDSVWDEDSFEFTVVE